MLLSMIYREARRLVPDVIRVCRSGERAKRFFSSKSTFPRETGVRDWTILGAGLVAGTGLTVYATRPGGVLPRTYLDSQHTGDTALTKSEFSDQGAGDYGSITADELGRHNDKHSLWVAINGDVWDVTDFVDRHPGGSQVLIEHAGKDVTKLFSGIHPEGTLESNLASEQKVGRLDETAIEKFANLVDDEDRRIAEARSKLFGVDSVVTLDDFEKYAKDLVPVTGWEYYSTGAEQEVSMRNNGATFDRVFFRPRVMRKVSEVDTSTSILGVDVPAPFYVSPTALNALGQPLGEVAVTLGTAPSGTLQILSHVASKSLDEVLSHAKDGQKVGWQVYVDPDRAVAEKQIRHAHAIGAQSIWLTVDQAIQGRKLRMRYGDVERKPAPHDKPLTRGPTSSLSSRHDADLTWPDIAWIKSLAPGLPVVVKGIGAWEDVVLAKEHGADAVVLSNHGGRQLDFANPPLKTLLDLNNNAPDLVKDKLFQIYVDGGIRRGTDILKALCLGATAVGLGRPFIYAATGWGPEGVEKAIMIVREELEISMRLLGVTKIDQLGPEYLDLSRL